MKDRIDQLIEERAPWLFTSRPGVRLLRTCLNRLLSYNRALSLSLTFQDMPSQDIMATMVDRLAHRVDVKGLDNVPLQGPALIVSNHPTGIADGIILHHVLAPLRPDLYIFANSDMLRVLPQMTDRIAPVEWREQKRSRAKTRETMVYVRKAVDKDRLGVIFPSGRLAFRRGLGLHERPWMTSAAALARRYNLPVIPIHITARNSVLFYFLDLIHPTLRDISLFHETLNKGRQPFKIRVGRLIPPGKLPIDPVLATEELRRVTLALGDGHDRTISLLTAPSWRYLMKSFKDAPPA
jgi:putative hemolysin